jgi:lysine-specific demethylase 8
VLAQVVGSKYLRLYDAKYTDRLYTFSGALGHNSAVDIDSPDYEKHPLFKDLPCWQTILKSGELLYIPRLCWHYVKSLEMSFSVSFWFGAKMQLVKNGKKYTADYVRED